MDMKDAMNKSKAAATLVRLSWKNLSKEERSARSRHGGMAFKKKWEAMTDEERKAHMERVWSKRLKVLKKENL